jgi:hypothetical protein
VNIDDRAYTSPSIAENQKVSVKAYDSAPIAPAPNVRIVRCVVIASPPCVNIRRARCVIVQKRKRMQNADAIAFIALIAAGTYSAAGAKSDAKRANIIKSGAPGGCPTSNLYDVAINSLQSQRLVVGSMVSRYAIAATANTAQPTILFQTLNCSILLCF